MAGVNFLPSKRTVREKLNNNGIMVLNVRIFQQFINIEHRRWLSSHSPHCCFVALAISSLEGYAIFMLKCCYYKLSNVQFSCFCLQNRACAFTYPVVVIYQSIPIKSYWNIIIFFNTVSLYIIIENNIYMYIQKW